MNSFFNLFFELDLLFLFLSTLHGMQDLSFPTRDWIRVVEALDFLGNQKNIFLFLNIFHFISKFIFRAIANNRRFLKWEVLGTSWLRTQLVALEENPYVFCILDVDFIFKFSYSLQWTSYFFQRYWKVQSI